MHLETIDPWRHRHSFGTDVKTRAERRTWWVIGLTSTMMVVEIVAGLAFGSMALLADGWHMATHAAALGVAAFAYFYARRHTDDPRYSFGTGKAATLGGFASAVGLAVVAVLVFGESAARLAAHPVIRFDEAIAVAWVGLLVNVVCALLLRESDVHAVSEGDHPRLHPHDHDDHHHHDHNLRGAYLHVLADALTSVLAIGALTAGKYFGWTWMDAMTGLIGSVVIAHWSYGLLRDTSRVLLDAELGEKRRESVRKRIEADADNRVTDLHLWRVGPRHLAAIISVVTRSPREPAHYKQLLANDPDLVHITVEVHRCPDSLHTAA
jgi:cation diffusion facilitator family transporter